MTIPVTRWKCFVCGKVTAGRKFGDLYLPRKHKNHGEYCSGNERMAVRVDVEEKVR